MIPVGVPGTDWRLGRYPDNYEVVRHGFEVDGWTFDPTRGTLGLNGVEPVPGYPTFSPGMHSTDLQSWNVIATTPDTITLTAFTLRGPYSDQDEMTFRFTVFLRRPYR